MSPGYSKSKLFQIGKDNYKTLSTYCDILCNEGYWDKPGSILKQSMNEAMDLYIQAVLVQLALTCGSLNQEERRFIAEIPEHNVISITVEDEIGEVILFQAEKIMKAPPIIFQLLSLRDIEHSTSLAGMFFDAFLNILLTMAYLNNSKNVQITGFILGYFRQVRAFLNTNSKINYVIDEKYVFRKISNDELELSSALLLTSGGDFERYKGKLLYNNDKVKTDKSKNRTIQDNDLESYNEIRQEKQQKKQQEKQLEDLQEDQQDKLQEDQKENLEMLFEELNYLIGLDAVKSEINSLINLIKVRKLRENYNMPMMDMSYHMVYTGNPGTGKTTVARLVAKIYKELGILTEGNLIETDRSGLVAGFVGQTALKVKEVIEKAIGGVLFIDEAYSLSSGIGSNDFGSEAIDTLVKMMEDNRDNLVIIVAGYREEMQQFLKSNTGLVSRFNKFIDFADYTNEELISILESMAKKAGFIMEEKALQTVKGMLINLDDKVQQQFGNARGIRNLFEKLVVNQANRVVNYQEPTKEQLSQIIFEDVYNVL